MTLVKSPGLVLCAVYFKWIYWLLSKRKTKPKSATTKTKQKTPWPLVRKRNIPTERPSLVGEIKFQLLRIEGCRVVSAADPARSLNSVFYTGPKSARRKINESLS
jgi:hypothetical protein